jgi:exonuclease SbcD
MKLLHTSDWHVGRNIRGRSRSAEHEAVLAEIASIAAEEHVDLILVTGDLFDTAAPTPEAERVCYRALLDLEATGAQVVVICGNHDNPRRLEAVAPMLARGAVTVVPALSTHDEGGLLEFTAGDGSAVQIACLPFLSQRAALNVGDLFERSATEQSTDYGDYIGSAVRYLCEPFRKDSVKLVAAHLFARGGAETGSERAAHTAFGYAVSAQVFPPTAHYVALGHLHRPQSVTEGRIRYAGSPLQLDFGEAGEAKSVVVVEATPATPASVRTIALRSGIPLVQIEGSLEELEAFAPTAPEGHQRIVVRSQARAGLAEEVRAMFPLAVDVVLAAPEATGERRNRPSRAGRTPSELFATYLAESDASDPRVEALFAELLDATMSSTNAA